MTPRTSPDLYVTGSSGALGGALVAHLGARADIVPVSRARWPWPDTGWFDPEDTHATIIHAAGGTQARGSGHTRGEVAVHLDLFAGLCARGWRGRLVFLSSVAVYGAAACLPTSERAPPAPLTPYGCGKLALEAGLSDLVRAAGGETTILRLSNVYGTPLDLDRGRVIALIIDAAFSGKPFTIFGDGSSRRDYLHVSDFCAGVGRALDAPPGIYNLASGAGVPLVDLIGLVERASGRTVARTHAPAQAEAPVSAPDIAKAARCLGWRPTVSLEDGIADMVARARSGWGLTSPAE